MNNVKINGKDFPVKFSFHALDELCELRECSLAELDELSDITKVKPIDVLYLAFVGLKEGARRLGKPFALSLDDVDDMLSDDITAIGRIMSVYTQQNTPPAGNPTAPSKATGQKKQTARKKTPKATRK